MFELDGSVEDDFLDLIEHARSKELFLRGAKLMLGENWKELGSQILEETGRSDLSEKFNSYRNADQETA